MDDYNLKKTAENIKTYCNEVLNIGCSDKQLLKEIKERIEKERMAVLREKLPRSPKDLARLKYLLEKKNGTKNIQKKEN